MRNVLVVGKKGSCNVFGDDVHLLVFVEGVVVEVSLKVVTIENCLDSSVCDHMVQWTSTFLCSVGKVKIDDKLLFVFGIIVDDVFDKSHDI